MPQMAPIWWFTLFLVFILTYYNFMVILYYYKIYNLKNSKTEKMSSENTNWKW